MLRGAAAVLTLGVALVAAPAARGAEFRLALVIGNGAYESEGKLKNPAHDAQLMADTLRSLGFWLVGGGPQVDVSRMTMRSLLLEFAWQLSCRGDKRVALFFYSGRGFQLEGRNYLLPVDAAIRNEADLKSEGVSVDDVLGRMNAAEPRIKIVLLDGCRGNPFGKRGKTLRRARGLSKMQPERGSLIASAAQPGKVAVESRGKYSHFTEALAEQMKVPGADMGTVLRRVRAEVELRTGGRQTPDARDALSEMLTFKPPPPARPAAPPAAVPAPPAPLALKPGTVFRDRLREGSEGPEMVVVPAGEFEMGDLWGDGYGDEKPIGRVRISRDFAVGKHEVTFEEYDRFAEATERWLPRDECWGRGRRPAIKVSWDDAAAYAEWLSQQTGKRYRLPSEAEWEYAARSGGQREKWAGAWDEWSLGAVAWYDPKMGGKRTPSARRRPTVSASTT